jgi:hypothetical protein
LDKVRQRKLEARAHRQEALHPIAKKTILQVPQPKNLIVKETVKINKSPVATETVKRGRGRPPKMVSEKINTSKALTGKKTVKGKGKR